MTLLLPGGISSLAHSPDLIPVLFAGVPDDERKAILGGTLGKYVGFEPAKAKVGAR